MKRRFLLLSFLLSMASSYSFAQNLCAYDFNSYTLGNLATDATGVTAGQDGWYIYTTATSAAANTQIVIDPAAPAGSDKVLKVIGGTTATGNNATRFAWTDCVTDNYSSLGSNDSVIVALYDFYFDGTTNSKNRFALYFYDATGSKVLAGISVQNNTGNVYLVCNYNNAGTIANYSFGPVQTGTTPTNVVLSRSTWYGLAVIFHKNTGLAEVGIYNPSISNYDIWFVNGAAAGTAVAEADIIGSVNSSTAGNGSSNGYFDNIDVYAPVSLAPVTFTNFSGNREGNKNLLYWSTASESNNHGFEIQRSADGINFTTIGSVNSIANDGNSSTTLNYTYTDVNVVGAVHYYRLRQVDNDGKSSLSNVIAIRDNQALSLDITGLYPNPASNVVNLSITAPVTTKASLLITGVEGRTMTKQALTLQKGMNAQSVNISKFPAGTYLVKIIGNNGEVAVNKFVKK